MNILQFPHLFGQATAVEAAPGASEAMRTVIAAANATPLVMNERAALKLVEAPLAKLKSAPAEERTAFVFEAIAELQAGRSLCLQMALKGMTAALLRAGDLRLNALEAVRLVESASTRRAVVPHKAVLTAIAQQAITPALREALTALRGQIDEWHGRREMEEIHERIDTLLNGGKPETGLEAVTGWTRQVMREIDESPKQVAWRALFLHARSLTQSSASRKWQTEASALADRVGRADVLAAAHRWLALGPMPGGPEQQQLQVPDNEADYQKGFIWTLGAMGDASIAPDIADFAFACFRKIPTIGAVSHRVGNACVNALAAMPGLDAVTQISRLAVRVKYDVARRLIEKALGEAAQRNNVNREDLEAMSVPPYGLSRDGVRVEKLGGGELEAKLAIEDRSATLTWSRGGKPLKSLPTAVATSVDDGPAVAELKKTAKELDGVLSTQRLRLERQLLSENSCRFDRWKGWYIDHPVTSAFARDLIWEITPSDGTGAARTAVWHDGALVDWTGNAITPVPDSTVRLWHPIRSDVQTVLSWRCWLEDHGVRQPFKQAHREVYIITDAERATATFSNRFAAHIVRQHQFAALCRERGWQFNLMGQWDSHNTPTLALPAYKLKVEFEVEFPPNEKETTAHGVYLTIATGQVRFQALNGGKPDRTVWPPPEPLRLEAIPPVVFSEAMRDADLLVGVTSIGADPTWGINGVEERSGTAEMPHLDYWKGYAFGELSTAAENRRSVIESLLPKLAIRDRCRIDGRFLVVRGSLHEYRIHLGSGNIIIEPGSRYLCIVQGPGDTAAHVQLPFDGDRILALILSKALLLADDGSIRDETIRRQIRG